MIASAAAMNLEILAPVLIAARRRKRLHLLFPASAVLMNSLISLILPCPRITAIRIRHVILILLFLTIKILIYCPV